MHMPKCKIVQLTKADNGENRSPVTEDAPRPLHFKAFDQYWPDTAWLINRTTDRLS